MFKYILLPTFLLLLTGCGSVTRGDSPVSKQDDKRFMYDRAAYDEKYKGTKHERKAFDESAWDQIEAELRKRPR